MAEKIGGMDNRPVRVSTDRKVARAEDSAASSTSSTNSTEDPVQITAQAKQMAALEQTINSLPVVDEARVTEVRRALDEGRYEVNADRIADKLLRSERDLHG